MVAKNYIPNKGDIVWLEFGLALFCPITSQEKGYPFEVKINDKKIHGVVLSDQVKNFDWKSRKAKFIAKAKDTELAEVIEKIMMLIN